MFYRSGLRLLAAWLLAGALGTAAVADELALRAQLVWATDQKKPENAKYTELDSKSREKLRKYTWKNYWVVNKAVSPIGSKKPTSVSLSAKCAIDIRDAGDGFAEIRLFELKEGEEPKLVRAVRHSMDALRKGEYCILAGDDKAVWDDAWFVIVTAAQ